MTPNNKKIILLLLVFMFKSFESYEPLNLNAPNEYEVPTETFILCDLSQDFLRSYCQNQGICYTLVDHTKQDQKDVYSISEIYCSCPNDFTGSRCEVKIQSETVSYQLEVAENSSQPETKIVGVETTLKQCPPAFICLNGGTCLLDPIEGPKCVCKPDFTGINCAKTLSFCPDMSTCSLKCDFGYQINENKCETCSCNCVNEENFFDQMRITYNFFKNTNRFCSKQCKLGYVKDEKNCFKCQCLEDNLIKSDTIRPSIVVPNSQQIEKQNFENYCQQIKCESNEICKYFDKSFYTCPENRAECKKFENFSKFPLCVPQNLNQICMEEVSIGSCDKSVERYFYDPIEKKCKKFLFSGCLGNRNNFLTLHECSIICIKDEFIHEIPKIKIEQKTPIMNILKNTTTFIPTTNPSKVIELTSTSSTKSPETFKTITLPTIEMTTTNQSQPDVKSQVFNDPSSCQWVCDLNCPFGYKLNYRTKCYKCECIDLNMTECGVPCFPEGTSSCLHSMRANSRPKCVCNENFDGVYCQIYKKSSNFSARVERSIKINTAIANDIKTNLTQKLSDVLDISTNNIVVNELRNNIKDNYIIIKFSIYAPDFSNEQKFNSLINELTALLYKKNLTLFVLDQEMLLSAYCDKTEEVIAFDLNENYLFTSNKLKNMMEDLKTDLVNSYKLQSKSIQLVKLKIEPDVQLEVLLKNNANDPEFCLKTQYLKNDLQARRFMPSKFDVKFLSIQNTSNLDDKRFIEENYLETLSSENLFLSRNSDLNAISHLTSSVFLNHSIAYLSVIASSFFIIIFLVSLFIITQLKRRQNKKIAKFDELDSSSTFENYEKKTDFQGYFMPNYATVKTESSHARSSIEKLGVY